MVNGQNQLQREVEDLAAVVEVQAELGRRHTTGEADRVIETLAPFIAQTAASRPADWFQPPIFVPREDLLRRIGNAILGDPARLRVVSVWGLPGSGKSTVCEQFAFHYRERFPGGYARLRLDPQAPDSAEKLCGALCERFGIKGAKSQLAGLLAAALREPRTLVHIENADGDESARAAVRLAHQLPDCAILISGRQATLAGRCAGSGCM